MDSSGVAVAVPEVADALAAQRAYHEVPDLTARSAGSIGGLREAFVRRNISNSGLLISAKNGTTNNRHVQLIDSLFYKKKLTRCLKFGTFAAPAKLTFRPIRLFIHGGP